MTKQSDSGKTKLFGWTRVTMMSMMLVIVSLFCCAWSAWTTKRANQTLSLMRRRTAEIVAMGPNPTSPLGPCQGDCDLDQDVRAQTQVCFVYVVPAMQFN